MNDIFESIIDDINECREDLINAIETGNSYDVTRLIGLMAEHNKDLLHLIGNDKVEVDSFATLDFETINKSSKYNIENYIFCHPSDINIFKEIMYGIIFPYKSNGNKSCVVFNHFSKIVKPQVQSYNLYDDIYVPLHRSYLSNPKITE